ncbi:MAG: tetratricopeptide repeat protein [Candidatus Binatia bacterium]
MASPSRRAPARPRAWLPPLLAGIAVAAVTTLAFTNAAPNAFVYDDLNYLPIPWPAGESLPTLLSRLFAGDVWPERRLGAPAYRPLTFATIAIEGARHGPWLAGYHVTNIALHVAATVALYVLLLALLREPGGRQATPAWSAAALAAAVFGVHAIHTESVNCIFNRGDVLVTLLTLTTIAAVWSLLPSRPWLGWSVAAAGYALALFSKEFAVTFPALLLAVLVPLRFAGPWRERLRRAAPVLVLIVPLLAYLVARQAAMARTTWSSEIYLGAGPAAAMTLTAFRDMLAMVLWPWPLRAVRTDYVAWAVPLAIAVIAAYAAAIALAWRRLPGVAAGLLFFAIAVLPSLPLVTRLANAQIMAERYVYLPSAGLAIALAFALQALERRVGAWAAWVPATLAIGILLLLSRARNEAWHSDVALFEAEVAAAPGNPEAVLDLEMSYASAGRLADSLALCARHADAPAYGLERFFMNCGLRLERSGRLAEAEAFFRRGAGGVAPPPAYYSYGRYLVRVGRREEAARQYDLALSIERDPVRRHAIRAEMLLKLHPDRLDEALTEIDAALAQDPTFAIARDLRARIVAAKGAAPAAPTPRAGLADALRPAGPGTPVWLAVSEDDPGAAALANELSQAFAAAGWTLRRRAPTGFRMKPGVFVLAADAAPPAYVQTLIDALAAAGLSPTSGNDYRAYYAEAVRTRPGYQGFRLDDDQTYVLVIGPRP